jgi:hypothetical protein
MVYGFVLDSTGIRWRTLPGISDHGSEYLSFVKIEIDYHLSCCQLLGYEPYQ